MSTRYVHLNSRSASTAFSLAGSPCASGAPPGARQGVTGHVDVRRRGADDWVLRYDAGPVDPQGRLVVTWDSDLWKLAPGWYVLEVWLGCAKCGEFLARIGDECAVQGAETVNGPCADPCDALCAPAADPSAPEGYRPAYIDSINLGAN